MSETLGDAWVLGQVIILPPVIQLFSRISSHVSFFRVQDVKGYVHNQKYEYKVYLSSGQAMPVSPVSSLQIMAFSSSSSTQSGSSRVRAWHNISMDRWRRWVDGTLAKILIYLLVTGVNDWNEIKPSSRVCWLFLLLWWTTLRNSKLRAWFVFQFYVEWQQRHGSKSLR